jgi:IS30 family transposase
MKAGHDQSEIANLLDRNKSTISRELTRKSKLPLGCPSAMKPFMSM